MPRSKVASRVLLAGLLLSSPGVVAAQLFGSSERDATEKRMAIRKMGNETLEQLYREIPGARAEVESSVGFAVFDNLGVNVLLLSTARGYGIAREIPSGRLVYMKMSAVGAGLGVGVEDYRVVMIFKDRWTFAKFLDQGLEVGTGAGASGGSGDVASAEIPGLEGVKVYQITAKGRAIQATLQGTRYWKDEELN